MATRTADKGTLLIFGHEIAISNPDKLLWPEQGITKLMYLQKLTALAPYLLRYCSGRYLTTIRYPNGIHGKSFYQKNAPEPLPGYVRTATLEGIRYVNLDSVPTLLWLGNLASLEFHSSFHLIDDTLPAEWLLDIDPTQPEEPRIMEAAWLIGETLEKMNIRSVPKTSGATGIQIYVPIPPGRYTFEQLRAVGKFVAEYMVQLHPKLFTVERFIKNRGDLIYIDYLQHWYGKTLSAPYTPRAREFATVSAPLHWKEVKRGVSAREFNLLTMERRLADQGDLIAQLAPQSLDHVLAILPNASATASRAPR
ncbi:non-homologous end-joining DNA ligase [Paenibacillus cymbidii]|uniref:non-homologous end-joining DNA ligase n=1 Tax=Paenibacillus cymbidii TaxID=1639034 RepID=UPI00108174D1|nr:non-homologous end-joining DNA ligase [Paenibacillus cymbidii]